MRKEIGREGFQREVIDTLYERMPWPEFVIEKSDSAYRQGTPDLTIFYKDKWAKLECKADDDADHQPNQDDYVFIFNEMSFCRFIYPENKEEVLDELYRFFGIQ